MRPLRLLLPALALLLAPTATGDPPGFEIERRELFATLKPPARIEVRNVFGDVRARFGGYAGVVEVRAVLQHFEAEGARLEVELQEDGASLKVTVGERLEVGSPLRAERQAGQKKRADLVILVPQGVDLAVTTAGGVIEARGLKGSLSARSSGGDINARLITGDLDLFSSEGSVVAVPADLGRQSFQRFASGGGDITLYLKEGGHFSARVATGGLISTDFTLTFETGSTPPGPCGARPKRASATLGKGTTPLVIESAEGHVRLVLKPSASAARLRPPAGPP